MPEEIKIRASKIRLRKFGLIRASHMWHNYFLNIEKLDKQQAKENTVIFDQYPNPFFLFKRSQTYSNNDI